MAFDGALFDEALPCETASVAFHLRAVALVSKAGEIISRHHAELADVGKRSHFGSTQRVFPVSTAIDCSCAVESAVGASGIRSRVTLRLAMLSKCERLPTSASSAWCR